MIDMFAVRSIIQDLSLQSLPEHVSGGREKKKEGSSRWEGSWLDLVDLVDLVFIISKQKSHLSSFIFYNY